MHGRRTGIEERRERCARALAVAARAARAALLVLACGEAAPDGRPNVLWICVDVLRADRVGAYGYARPTSPSLDRLAGQGARFAHAFAQSSWTKPSVPSYLTSTYPSEHGVLEGSTQDREGRVVSDVLAPQLTTAAELFAEAGYATGAFVTNAQLRGFLGFAQGFEVYEEELGAASEINRAFEAWLASFGARPFFAYLHYLDVHWPYRPEARFREPFDIPATSLDVAGPGAPSLFDRINAGGVAVSGPDREAIARLYDASVRQADAAVGDVLEALARRGLRGDTLVVVSSDHGEELFEHGSVGHGRSLRDTLLHVPLILAGPGVPAGLVADGPVESIDILPTLLDLADLPGHQALRGRSLVPALAAPDAGQAADAPRPVFAELLRSGSYHRSVRLPPWKLVESYRTRQRTARSGPTGELSVAPGERVDVKGAFQEDGRFLARDFDREEAGGPEAVVRGVVTAFEPAAGRLAIGPIRVDVDEGTSWRRRGGWLPVDPDELAVGGVVEVDGAVVAPLRVQARKVELREDAELALQVKLEGAVEAVTPRPPALRLLGAEVVFESDVALPGIQPAAADAAPRRIAPADLRDPELYTASVELHDLAADPLERRDVAAAHPEVVERLRALLARHASAHVPGEGSARQALDPATVERLRALGYVD